VLVSQGSSNPPQWVLLSSIETDPVYSSWINATGSTVNQILRYNGTKYVPTSTGNLGTSTTGVTITNGSNAVIGSGTTIDIATASGTTTGLLTSTDWTTFNNKLSSTLNSGYIFVGNASNVATGVALSGDATISNTGAITVTGLQGRSVANTSPTNGQVLTWNNSTTQWEPQTPSSGSGWSLSGNSLTGSEKLGSTNNQPVVVITNNQETFQFNPTGSSAPAWSIQRGGGNPRGLHAVDLQSARLADTQVASGDYSVIGGGVYNIASGVAATVGGGSGNTASGLAATVGGGENNTASADDATVGGGYWNTASGYAATVGGGDGNAASGDFATVGGGRQNTAGGDYSVVPGGYSNTANGDYNLVFGENVDPSVSETHRVYFFGDGSCPPFQNCRGSGFLVINRLDGDYPIHVGTDNTNGNGAYLTTGGTWTNGSSRSFKERFVQYRPAEVLEKIRQLPVEGYFYKGTEEYHITPMAEDFYRLFGTGVHEIIETDSTGQLVRRPNPEVDKYLAASDVAGVALLGVKALDERMSTLGPQSSALKQRLEALEQENQQIKQENQQIKQENQQIKQENQRFRQQLEQVMERLALLEAQLSNWAESQK